VDDLVQVPEQGQIVEVRNKPYVVVHVQKTTLAPSLLGVSKEVGQTLVRLHSLQDDSLGEELSVIWELEPGVKVHEGVSLPEPTGFDSPKEFDAFLNAVRWGAASVADTRALQAPFRSGIEIEDYQLDPVARAIRMPRVNLLIADDVGLGKTIEAGLVVQEMIVRHRARSVLVVCPSALQIQWRDQMRDKFGLEFRIVDRELMRQLRRERGLHVNPWTHFPRLITSIDFLKRDRQLRLFREVLPQRAEDLYPRRFDFLIVDEAHNIAPQGRGRYSIESQRTAAIRLISPHFEHKLFLTATPHNGYTESFTALLELLDNQRFARGIEPEREHLRPVMVRRLKTELVDWAGNPKFQKQKIQTIEVPYTDEEKAIHMALKQYTKYRKENARDATERVATDFVLKLLKKRLFSCPEAFRLTLGKHEESIASAQHKKAKRIKKASEAVLRKRIESLEEDFGDDRVYEENTYEALDTATRLFRSLANEERKLVKQMKSWAESASKRVDSKANQFMNWLKSIVKPNGTWLNERVIIFTEYRDTMNWLHERLSSVGLADEKRLMTLYGGMDSEKREAIKAAFQASPKDSLVRILLATDAASEGIDLQNHCHRVVHYEIPWNPNRLEQRNGRLDRHGQKNQVLVYHFVSKGYDANKGTLSKKPGDLDGDLEFLAHIVNKIENIREDLGKVGPVIASQVEEAMLGDRKTLDTSNAEKEARKAARTIRFERNLKEQITRLHEQLTESMRDLNVNPQSLYEVIETALSLAAQPSLQPAKVDGFNAPVYRIPALKGSWARCSEGLAHPHTHKMRPITFDINAAAGRDDVVLCHLNHRLAAMSQRLLRAEIWSSPTTRLVNRVTARIVPDDALDAPAVIGHARLVVIGGDYQRLHEEIISAGGIIRHGRFSRLNVGDIEKTLVKATNKVPSKSFKQQIQKLWGDISKSLILALEARMKERFETLQNTLAIRAETEAKDIKTILEELAKHIKEELKETSRPFQLELFTDLERDQFNRDIDALKTRLESIPREIDREKQIIFDRFANPQPRMFPVGVTFLVPEKIGAN